MIGEATSCKTRHARLDAIRGWLAADAAFSSGKNEAAPTRPSWRVLGVGNRQDPEAANFAPKGVSCSPS